MHRDQVHIESLFNEFYRLIETSDVVSVHDIYFRVDPTESKIYLSNESGEVSYVGDIALHDYADLEDFITHVIDVLGGMKEKGYFDRPLFDQPLSVLYVTEDQEIIRELLLVDDDWVRLDDPLMKDVDQELDDFFAQLMQDNS